MEVFRLFDERGMRRTTKIGRPLVIRKEEQRRTQMFLRSRLEVTRYFHGFREPQNVRNHGKRWRRGGKLSDLLFRTSLTRRTFHPDSDTATLFCTACTNPANLCPHHDEQITRQLKTSLSSKSNGRRLIARLLTVIVGSAFMPSL